MTDAFKCDLCELFGDESPFHEGKPTVKLFTRADTSRQEYNKVIDSCESCAEVLGIDS